MPVWRLTNLYSRSKISNDPRNTTWANNTTRFGHRILTSQGWQPGDSLGATDASHAAHYTAASHSHIRVLLKDDNLGLGAKRGSERAENFGLAGLESILGRLNGRETEVKKEEERREEIEKRAYVYRKYGMMNFVSGGFLVGDKITKKADIKKEPEEEVKVKLESESESSGTDKQSRKRKRDRQADTSEVKEGAEEPRLKRKKKSMNLREEAKSQLDSESQKMKKDKKDKKGDKKKSKSKNSGISDPEPMTSGIPTPASDPEPLTDKARRKAEKRARKEEKKLMKALKKAAKSKSQSDDSSSESETDENAKSNSTPSSSSATGTSTPVLASAGLTFNATHARGMHAVRQRWIRNKKAATMDAQALKEV